ncbi:unnamed protein product, partial [Mesorhabditis spiculigera]
MQKQILVNGLKVWVDDDDIDKVCELFKDNVIVDNFKDWESTERMEKYEAKDFIKKARHYASLQPPDLVQAAEKIWFSAVYGVKHLYLTAGGVDLRSHNALKYFCRFALYNSGVPLDRFDKLYDCWLTAEKMHRDVYGSCNFHPNAYGPIIDEVEAFVAELTRFDQKALWTKFEESFIHDTKPEWMESDERDYSFPFPPYAIQNDLMNEIFQCIERRQVGIFESPTGTGKSLSVLCATLSWLEYENRRVRAEMEEAMQKEKEKKGEIEADGSDWVKAHAQKLKVQGEADEAFAHLEMLRKIDERVARAKRGEVRKNQKRGPGPLDEYEFISEKKEAEDECAPPADYNSDDNSGKAGKEEEKGTPLRVRKIFYASRTHSQLDQLVDELMKTRFRPRIVTAASRQHLCVNEEVRKLKNGSQINEKCMELRKNSPKTAGKRAKDEEGKSKCKSSCSCPYYKTQAIEDTANGILAGQDIRSVQVFEKGQKVGGCPYFASKAAIPLCEIVLVPYQVVLHEETRETWGIDMRDDVLVLDEAHNVLDSIAAMNSGEVLQATLAAGLSAVRTYFLERVDNFLKRSTTTESVLSIPEFFIQANLTDINIYKLASYIKATLLCRKLCLFNLRERKKSQALVPIAPKKTPLQQLMRKKESAKAGPLQPVEAPKPTPPSPPVNIYAIGAMVTALTNKCEDARVVVVKNEGVAKVRFILFNAGSKLMRTIAVPRSTIMIGGTMEPSSFLVDSLVSAGLPSSRIRRFACSHVIDDDQLCAIAFEKSIDGQPLETTFKTRDDQRTSRSLGESIVKLVSLVPTGVVVFVPSYNYMEAFMQNSRTNGVLAKLERLKPVFYEKRDATTNEVWEKYSKAIETRKSALLFAVVGGKLSEGINFSNDLCRAVIIIGLPYANKGDVELNARLKYADSLRPGSGAQLYQSMCMHAVNQAVGRAIRHRNDYSAIFFLDRRYASPSVSNQLSKWIGSRLQTGLEFAEITKKVELFFKDKL